MAENKNFIQLKSPQIAIVEASAGSGKTYALAKRFLQLLINRSVASSDYLRTILAITFTNKAAYEMKERILEILKNIALDSFPTEEQKNDIITSLGVDYDFARQKAHLLIEEIIRHYSHFGVKTIDSFINSLLLGCSLHIGRSATFRIKRDYKDQLLYALDSLIDKSLSDKFLGKELNNFLRHYLFVENRGSWFPKSQILDLMIALFELVNRYGKDFSKYETDIDSLLKAKSRAYKKIKELAISLPPSVNKRTKNSVLNFIEQNNQQFEIAKLPNALSKQQPALNKGKSASEEFLKKWNSIYQQIKQVVQLEAEVSYNPYIGLFNQVGAIFESFSQKEDLLFLSQLNRQARFLFSQEGITVAELYYRLATRFQHYLIDEFQDTSRIQWDNLSPMVEEGLSSGGTLFYVGDKKQAIYRFRGGQSQLFDKIRERFLGYQTDSLFLKKNWRSQKEIVKFNNFIFSSQNILRFLKESKISKELEKDNYLEEIVNNFSDSEQSYREGNDFGYVYIQKLNETNQTQRNQIVRKKVVELIEDLKKRFSLTDIALLTRDNRELELLTGWLLEEGVPVESEKTLNVLEHPQIKELISFLKFLYSPVDDLSFASFILGDIFSKKAGLDKDQLRTFLFNLQKLAKKDKANLYRKFLNQFPEIWKKELAPFFKTVGFISPYQLLIAIYKQFDLPSNFPQSQAFFKKFLQLCNDSQEEKTGLWGFLDYLKDPSPDKLYVNTTAKNSVKILTIHKAKGLEFPVVVVPFLKMSISPETGTAGTKSYLEIKDSRKLHLLRITKEYRRYSDRLENIYKNSYKLACIDELNNIYVALTRPKHELYAFIPKKSGKSNNQALFLIDKEKIEIGQKVKYSSLTVRPKIKKTEASSYKDWAKYLSEEFSEIGIGKARGQIREGIILHKALSVVGDCSDKDINKVIEAAVFEIKNSFSLINIEGYRKKIKEIITNSSLKDIFFCPKAFVYCEKEIVDKKGVTKRIDRLIVFKDKVVVVDYKKSRSSSEIYYKQLKDYVKAIAGIYPKKKIKAVIVYLEDCQKEYLF
ncbi:MAG: UvrD-helicase domain-containing protein [Candidatus Omnitrophica bacterium]|nr:UvrD-helicase domain-containing protein [Candidatus Omnitrophota bacterium]MCF7893790.1 UvrD-helicase domain-containing protein [Candidatus Omnitrophota bacterium]